MSQLLSDPASPQKNYNYLFLLSFLVFVLALPPINFSLFGLVFLLPLLFVIGSNCSHRDAFILGFSLGGLIGAYVFLGTFIYIPVYYFAVIACVAGFFGICTLITHTLLPIQTVSSIVAIASIWVIGEFVLEAINLPFSIAVPLADNQAIIQLAYYGGQYLITWFTVFLQVAIYTLVNNFFKKHRSQNSRLLFGAVLFTIVFLGSINIYDKSPNQAESLQVAAIQTNTKPIIGHHQSADRHLEDIMREIYTLDNKARANNFDLIVWPEMSFIGLYAQNNMFRSNPNADVLVNTIYLNDQGERYNSIFLQNKNSTNLSLLRHKEILVPGVETDSYFSSMQSSLSTSRYLPLICFESAFPKLTRRHIKTSIDILTISTSDAFAGPAFQYLAHNEYAKLRAVEANRYVVRAANGGITTIIDPSGKVIAEAMPFTSDVISAEIFPIKKLSVFHRFYNFWIAVYFLSGLYAIFLCYRIKKLNIHHHRLPNIVFHYSHFYLLTLLLVFTFLFFQYTTSKRIYSAANSTDSQIKFTYHTDENDPTYLYSKTIRENSLAGSISFILREYGVLTKADELLQIENIEEYLSYYNLSFTESQLDTNFPIATPFIVQNESGDFFVVLSIDYDEVNVYSPVAGRLKAYEKNMFIDSLKNEYLQLTFIDTSNLQ